MRHVQKLAVENTKGAASSATLKAPPDGQPAPQGDGSAKAADAAAERLLVRRAQEGDASAYEQLVRKHQHRVLAVIGGILRYNEDVEDVAQQALVKAYFSLKNFDQRSAFSTWLYKIAVNECWDYFRKKKVRRLVYEGDLTEDQRQQLERAEEGEDSIAIARPPDAEQASVQRQLIERLLSALDEEDRTMLIMKEVEGFTVGEIGEILGLNMNTVKVRLFRSRSRLAKAYRRIKITKSRAPQR